MKPAITTAVFSLLTLTGLAAAAKPPKPPRSPKPPQMEYLYQVNITGGEAATVGAGPQGFRVVVPIVTGAFSGPRIGKGIIIASLPCLATEKQS